MWQLAGFPPNAINVYLIDDVLIDALNQVRRRRRIFRELKDRKLSARLTHAHPDHQGASHAVCEHYALPFWVGENDADAADPGLISKRQPDSFMAQFFARTMTGRDTT